MANFFIDNPTIESLQFLEDGGLFDPGEFGLPPPSNPILKHLVQLTGALNPTYPVTPPNLRWIDAVGTLENRLRIDVSITDGNVAPATVIGAVGAPLNGIATQIFLREVIANPAALIGGLSFTTFSQLDQDFRFSETGTRPGLPLLVYAVGITDLTEINDGSWQFEEGQPFLISDDFIPTPGDPLFEAGALPGYVGRRVTETVNDVVVDAIRFRPPGDNEVVYDLTNREVLRFQAVRSTDVDDIPISRWFGYVTLPQRALRGVEVFEQFDPTGVYDYYASVWGLLQYQYTYDTYRLRDFTDPLQCPPEYLTLLADNFGAVIDDGLPTAEKREVARNFLPLMKIKGTAPSVEVSLRMFGYQGGMDVVWVDPDSSDPLDFIALPMNYTIDSTDVPYDSRFYPSTGVIIHVNQSNGENFLVIDEGIKQGVAEFLKLNVLAANIYIRGYATDFDVTNGQRGEPLQVAESLVITQVPGGAQLYPPKDGAIVAVAGDSAADVQGELNP